MKILKFEYYDEFHCIGPECKDSCCKHWTITLTKREYLNYKKMDCSPELKSIIDTAFVRSRKDDLQYAVMKLKENGNCPFLGEDRLCKIQKEKGEGALTFVCSIFPRYNINVGDEVYIYVCDITCSHVVEILMNHPEGLSVTEKDYDGKNPWIEKGVCSGKKIQKEWESYPFFWTIKNAQLDILQNRNFTIPERMLILGFFCKKVDDYLKANEGNKIQGLANALLDNEMCRKIADSLNAPQSHENAAIKSVDILSKMNYYLKSANYSFFVHELFKKVLDNIELATEDINDDEFNVTFNRERYNNNVKIYREIEAERPYIFENLFVNLIFNQDYEQGLWANFFELAVFYNIFKVCIPAFLNDSWTDSDLALAITYSAKMAINSKIAQKQISENFSWNNSFDLPHAAFLIS